MVVKSSQDFWKGLRKFEGR